MRMTSSAIIPFKSLETSAKILDGNKWEKRFLILQKCSFGNSGSLYVFKTAKSVRKFRAKKQVLTIEGFFGVEAGFRLDDEQYTLAILCQARVIVLAFADQSTMITWEWSIRKAFGFGYQYSVYALEAPLSLSSICNSTIRLHVFDGRFCLVADCPPRMLADFRFGEIRRFGAFENKFCVEAGSRAGSWAGVYVFRTGHCDQMASTFRLASYERLHEYLSSGESSSDTSSTEPHPVYEPLDHEKPLILFTDEMIKDDSVDEEKPLISPVDVTVKKENTVQYAKIDKVATQAARQVFKTRKEDAIRRRSSTDLEDALGRWSSTEFLCDVSNKDLNARRKSKAQVLHSIFRFH